MADSGLLYAGSVLVVADMLLTILAMILNLGVVIAFKVAKISPSKFQCISRRRR